MSKKKLIFSFDVSTVGSDNLESKSWAKIGQSYRPPRSFQYDFLHMLAIINSTEFIAFQFVRGKITARVIGCFFVEAIARIRQTIPGSIRAWIIIDNAPVNKSSFLNDPCATLNVKLVFIVPSHPFLNPIKLFWANLKCSLRAFCFLPKFEIPNKLLESLNKITLSHYQRYFRSLLQIW